MAAVAQAAVAPRGAFDILKAELHLSRANYVVLARIVIAVVVTFLIAATFRMPYAAITLYSVFTLDRSSHRAAILRTLESVVAITAGVVMALAGVELFIDFPLITFAYYGLELFAVAFLIRTTRLPGPAMNMSMAIYSVHNIWERPYPVGPHLEQTLWVWLTLCLGFVVAIAVELAFTREDPLQFIRAEWSGRLEALAKLFGLLGTGSSEGISAHETILRYAHESTARIRARINAARQTDPGLSEQLMRFSAGTALLARLIDMSATIAVPVTPGADESERWKELAGETERIRRAIHSGEKLASYSPEARPSGHVPLLPELERTVALMQAVFASPGAPEGDAGGDVFNPEQHVRIFLPDAFQNTGYVLFALKTTIAALLCYVVYSGLNWPGIGTSVVTCLVTALTTVGATKQKQMLRLAGATFGGLLAIGSVVFLLPEFDSITAVTILVAVVSAISAWFTLASQRVSYFGLQTALAFYLGMIQDYSASAQLSAPRDRVFGVLLGVLMMWLVFDNLWPVHAVEHMRTGLARNLRLLAQVLTSLDENDREAAIRKIRDLRDRLQQGFAAVHGHADSVLFEFGSSERERHLRLREVILRWQASARMLLLAEIAVCQYRTQVVPWTVPDEIRDAQGQFHRKVALALRAAADAVETSRPPSVQADVRLELQEFEDAIRPWLSSLTNVWMITRARGIGALLAQVADLTDGLIADMRRGTFLPKQESP